MIRRNSMRKMRTTLASVALLLALVLSVSGVAAINPGQGSSTIAVMNIETGQANVVPVLNAQSGAVAETLAGFTLEPYGSKLVASSEWTVGNGFIGSMTLFSDKQLATVALLGWSGGDAPDGRKNATYVGSSEPSGALYFPDANITPSFYSFLAIQNTGGADVEITMTYYRDDGTQTAQVVDTIPASGQHSYDLSDPSDPMVPDLLALVSSTQWKGSVYVEATDPPMEPVLAGVAVRQWVKWAGSYSGFADGATDLYFPVITRRINSLGWFQYTSVQLFNTQPTTTTIDMEFRDIDGNVVNKASPCSYSYDVGERQFFSFTTHELYPGMMTADCLNFGTQFDGSLYISATQQMVGVANNIRIQRDSVGTYEASFEGSDEILLPIVYKKQASSGGAWRIFSNILLMNLDDTNPTDVTVEFYDTSGNLLLTLNDGGPGGAERLEPLSPIALNTRYGGNRHVPSDYNALPYNYQGAARITSTGEPVVAVVDTLWVGNQSGGGSYNGYNP
jgi:hypothetical protein